ncbi:hypothetical protein ACT3TE_17080 [Brachybacterium sp. AOP42-B2-9]|uniref:hypothetical protein n=1 Tax=Brachybacterium sp. AOP42-B2-9 TaxID=3457672 RepID=UPI004034AC0D
MDVSPISCFLDESEFRPRDTCQRCGFRSPTIFACGAAVAETPEQRDRFEYLYREFLRETLNSPPVRNHASTRERLTKDGFHMASDDQALKGNFLSFLERDPGLKFHYRCARVVGHRASDDKKRIYAILHNGLTSTIIKRYKKASVIEFSFEEFTGLNHLFSRIVDFSVDRQIAGGDDCPTVNTSVVKKLDSGISSAVDYCILSCSRLIQIHDARSHEARCAKNPDPSTHHSNLTIKHLRDFAGDSTIDYDAWQLRDFANLQASLSSTLEIKLDPGVLLGT